MSEIYEPKETIPRKNETDYDPEAYREKKQAEKQEVFALLDEATAHAVSSDDGFKSYLDLQSKLDRYSVSNTLLILTQCPGASQLKTYDDWSKLDIHIKRKEKAIRIIEPTEYEKKDGSTGKAYNVKKIFDVSQTDEGQKKESGFVPEQRRTLLKTLLENTPVRIIVVDLYEQQGDAYFDSERKEITVRKELSEERFFKALAKEISFATIAVKEKDFSRESAEFHAEAASYMLCNRYGFLNSDSKAPIVPRCFRGMKAKDVRGELTKARNVMHEINRNMQQSFEKHRQNNEKER